MKKAYLSIASLLACITLAACNPTVISSSEDSTPSSENVPASSVADVFTYTLELETPSVTTYEVGDVFDFASVGVKEQTFKNGSKDGNAKTLTRNEFVVKVNGQVIDGNFTFSTEGEVEFVISSAAHSEATASFKLTAVKHYSITNGSADKVVLTSLPEKALAGETINFGVTLLPGFYLESGVKVLNDAGEEVETHDNGDFTYSFTMPAGNVTITINTGITDFTISKDQELIGDVIVEGSEDMSDTSSAVPGTKLKFQATETVDTSFSAIYVDGVVVEKGEDDFYHFTMPHHPVVISAERTPKEYAIVTNAASLTMSTLKMYTNPETKEAVTTAHKGQTVYLEFASDNAHMKYDVKVSNGSESIEVKQIEGSDTFTFTMVSHEISIEIGEEDYSKYYGYYLTEKNWKFTSFGFFYKAAQDELSFSRLTKFLSFESNGTGKWDLNSFTWEQESDATSGSVVGTFKNSYSTYEKPFYYTEHLIVMNPSTYSSTSWTQVGVGTWDDSISIHTLSLQDGETRLAYVLNTEGAVTESIAINGSDVYVNPTIYTSDNKATLAKGTDISLTSSFYIDGTEKGFEISEGTVRKAYNLGITEGSSDQITITYKNANGEAITKAKNGETVTVSLTLSEEATAAGLSIDTPTISTDDRYAQATLTAVEGQENTYTFEMPAANVSIKALTFNPNIYAGYAVLGKYVGFELYGTTTSDVADYSKLTSYNKFAKEITKSGKFLDTAIGKAGNISELSNTTKGTFVVSDDTDNTHFNKQWFYSNGIIATFWDDNPNSQELTDTYVAVRVPNDFDPTTLSTKIHWINNGKSWALEFYLSNSLIGSIFATNKTFYCGATFEMTGTSTRIEKNATYTVKLDGQAIFNVANETVTAAE